MKKRKYGDAWKDVQIDAEQNDAVFDRFFRHSEPPTESFVRSDVDEAEASFKKLNNDHRIADSNLANVSKSTSGSTPGNSTVLVGGFELTSYLDAVKQKFRLSKGEVNLLRYFINATHELGVAECYATIPVLAESTAMTTRGCQLALKNLQSRGFVARVEEYDPSNRLGIKFQVSLLSL